jgi:hypothetical protein
MNDLLDDINVWSHHEDDGLMLGLHHILVRQKHFLLHFRRLGQFSNHEGKHLDYRFIHVQRFASRLFIKILYELFFVVLSQKAEVYFVLGWTPRCRICLHI